MTYLQSTSWTKCFNLDKTFVVHVWGVLLAVFTDICMDAFQLLQPQDVDRVLRMITFLLDPFL